MNASTTGSPAGGDGPTRPQRRDAAANRERLLVAAAEVVRTRGYAVPLDEIAVAAGVGIGTLYRHFSDRDALLAALGERSQQLVLDEVHCAAHAGQPPLAAVRAFLERLVERRDELVLPLLGGPLAYEQAAVLRRDEIVETLDEVLDRGRAEGSIRPDASALDIVLAGALLAQPFTATLDWAQAAHRHLSVYLDGLAAARSDRSAAPPTTREDLEAALTPDRPARPDKGPSNPEDGAMAADHHEDR